MTQSNVARLLDHIHIQGYQPELYPYDNHDEPLLTTYNALFELSHLGLVKISGEDCHNFLQGQLSCDMADVKKNGVSLACYSNSKGRVLASLYVFQLDDEIFLQTDKSLTAVLIDTLKKYAYFSKVLIEDFSDQMCGISLTGMLAPQFLNFDLSKPRIEIRDNVFIINKTNKLPRFEIYSSNLEAITQLWDQASASIQSYQNQIWHFLNIRRGIAFIHQKTSLQFTPHHLNYHLLDGISLDKGCYLGQEIIARMHFRNQPANRLLIAELCHKEPLSSGDKLNIQLNDEAVTLVNTVPIKSNSSFCLVMCKDVLAFSAAAQLSKNSGEKIDITFSRLPSYIT